MFLNALSPREYKNNQAIRLSFIIICKIRRTTDSELYETCGLSNEEIELMEEPLRPIDKELQQKLLKGLKVDDNCWSVLIRDIERLLEDDMPLDSIEYWAAVIKWMYSTEGKRGIIVQPVDNAPWDR